jgi:hypothetical protein
MDRRRAGQRLYPVGPEAAEGEWASCDEGASRQVCLAPVQTRTFSGQGYATWGIRVPKPDGSEWKVPLAWDTFAAPTAVTPHTSGYQWNFSRTSRTTAGGASLVTLPEYRHLEDGDSEGKARWVPVAPDQVPTEMKLQETSWLRPAEEELEPCTAPEPPASCWRSPGPAAGRFRARLGDGSLVT